MLLKGEKKRKREKVTFFFFFLFFNFVFQKKKDILKQTDSLHPDYADLQLAMAKLQEFTVHMDAEAQRSEALRIIESKLTGDLKLLHAGQSNRRFLHEGPLVDTTKQRKVYMFLFSDIAVLAKEPETKGSGITLRRGGSVAAAAEATKMQIVEYVTLSEFSRCTNIKSFDQKSYEFKLDGTTFNCASDEERQIWVDHLHRVLRSLRNRATKLNAEMGVVQKAAEPKKKAQTPTMKHRWSQSSNNDYESLLMTKASDGSPSVKRGSASGISLGGSRSRRAASAVGDDVTITTNPLLAARERNNRQRSASNVLESSTQSLRKVAAAAASQEKAEAPDGNLEKAEAPDVKQEATPVPPPLLSVEPVRAEVKFSFKGSSEKELSVEAGQIVIVVKNLASGWSVCQVGERMGAVPASYLTEL